MTEGKLLLTAICALAFYGMGQVWLVQLSSYPLWALVGDAEFRAYHAAWWRSIWLVILGPSALLALATPLLLWWPPPFVPAWEIWAAAALQAALVLGTAFWWAPLMANLETSAGGLATDRYELLMATHWVRVALVSAYAALTFWMLLKTTAIA